MTSTVYLINLSFGLAGIERRFANIWHVLRRRGNVRPILVVPDTLAWLLADAGLVTAGDDLLWCVRESPWLRALSRLPLSRSGSVGIALLRSRAMARAYRHVWARIADDPAAVVHIGMNCSGLNPPVVPIVYECVDSTLSQLESQHYVRAARRRCIVHCQTDRIRTALEGAMAARAPRWTSVTSPCYFATYPELDQDPVVRDPRLIAFVGRFSVEKNPLLFLDAIARLRVEGTACRGLMLGQGPLRSAIDRRIDDLGLQAVVEVGFSPRPAQRLREAAVFVTLQTGDNFGSQSLLEAMGSGCAIVATDVGETFRLVSDRVGRRIDGTVAGLSAALRTLLCDPVATAVMGTAANHEVRTNYTADAYVAFLEAQYARARVLNENEKRVAVPADAQATARES